MEDLNTEVSILDTLTCRTCGKEKEDELFAKNPTLPQRRGREYECKDCAKLIRLVNKIKKMTPEARKEFEESITKEYDTKMSIINSLKEQE